MRYGARLRASVLPPRVPTVDMTRAGAVAAAASDVTDWTTVPPDGDPLANDRLSCCVPAAIYRWVQIKHAARYLRVEMIDAGDVVRLYSRVAGYDPATGSHDDGSDPNVVMTSWATDADLVTFAGQNWPILWAMVRPTDPAEVAAAMRETPLLVTVWLPRADADDPDNWANPPGQGAEWDGAEGHEMLLVQNDQSAWTVRTWGRDYRWHHDRVARYVHRLDVPLEVGRTDPTRLGLDFTALT